MCIHAIAVDLHEQFIHRRADERIALTPDVLAYKFGVGELNPSNVAAGEIGATTFA